MSGEAEGNKRERLAVMTLRRVDNPGRRRPPRARPQRPGRPMMQRPRDPERALSPRGEFARLLGNQYRPSYICTEALVFMVELAQGFGDESGRATLNAVRRACDPTLPDL